MAQHLSTLHVLWDDQPDRTHHSFDVGMRDTVLTVSGPSVVHVLTGPTLDLPADITITVDSDDGPGRYQVLTDAAWDQLRARARTHPPADLPPTPGRRA